MNPGEGAGLVLAVVAFVGASWRLTRGLYRLVRIGEKALERLTKVEGQLKNNGGNSARDVLDKIHAVAVANQEANTRVENGQREALILAGEAATTAALADQRVRELGDLATGRHRENTMRLDHLEAAATAERIRREFYLATLRELYGIELPADPS